MESRKQYQEFKRRRQQELDAAIEAKFAGRIFNLQEMFMITGADLEILRTVKNRMQHVAEEGGTVLPHTSKEFFDSLDGVCSRAYRRRVP